MIKSRSLKLTVEIGDTLNYVTDIPPSFYRCIGTWNILCDNFSITRLLISLISFSFQRSLTSTKVDSRCCCLFISTINFGSCLFV